MAVKNKTYNLTVKESGSAELKKIASSLDKTNESLKKVAKTSKSTSKSMSSMRNSMASLVAVLSVREVARFADSFQLLEDRLTVFANEGETGVQVMRQLNEVATATRASLTGLAEGYNRIAISTKDLGLSTQQMLTVTQALQQTFRLSGSTTAESTSSTIQLTQGLAAGALRGQELRSVLEANAVYGGLLADKLKVTRGELIKMGEQGKITADIALSVLTENFEKLNEQADKLRPTFEQGVSYALNEIGLRLNNLNKTLNVSGGFYKSMKLLAENVTTLGAAASTVVASQAIPALTAQLGRFFATATSAGAVSFGAIASSIAAVGLIAVKVSDDLVRSFDKDRLLERRKGILIEFNKISKQFADAPAESTYNERTGAGKKSAEEFRIELNKLSKELDVVDAQLLEFQKPKGKKGKEIGGLSEKKLFSFKESVAELNKEFKNKGPVLAYREALLQLNIKKLDQDIKNGSITMMQYKDNLEKVTEQLGLAKKEAFNLGAAITSGTDQYIKSAGTLAENIATAISGTFKTLENELFDFVKTGKLRFADLTQSILDDLLKIAIRQGVTKPLAGVAGSLFSGGAQASGGTATTATGSGYSNYSANGNVFTGGNVIPFAKGGIVGSPTNFAMSGGRTGLMGEAGPEGIVPLSRGKNGKLGINASGLGSNVVVNVVNNSDASATTQESEGPDGEKIIDVIIGSKMKEKFADGTMDRTMKSTYGLSRKAR